MKATRLLLAASLLTVAFPILQVSAQTPDNTSGFISVNSGRPIADALSALEKRYGLAITYEDPEYVHPSDVRDVTATVSKRPGSGSRVLVPKGGSFQFSYAVKDGRPEEDTTALIHRMLMEYAAQGGPRFDVQERIDGSKGLQWHVVPVRIRDKSGEFVERPALLDNIISIPRQEYSGTDMLNAVCQQLSQLSGHRIIVGSLPFEVFHEYHAEFGATNQRARDVLSELVEKPPSLLNKTVWRLLYDPGLGWYAINIHVVSRTAATPIPTIAKP